MKNDGILYRLSARDAWVNGAWDEQGESVLCDLCGEEMKWNPVMARWYCTGCEQEMDRAVYFNHIGAQPPSSICLTDCEENYPFCKKICDRVEIDPDDPILD